MSAVISNCRFVFMSIVAVMALCVPKLAPLAVAGNPLPAATATAIAVSSGGSPVSSVASGTAVTLTATVTTDGTVSGGTVEFCESLFVLSKLGEFRCAFHPGIRIVRLALQIRR